MTRGYDSTNSRSGATPVWAALMEVNKSWPAFILKLALYELALFAIFSASFVMRGLLSQQPHCQTSRLCVAVGKAGVLVYTWSVQYIKEAYILSNLLQHYKVIPSELETVGVGQGTAGK